MVVFGFVYVYVMCLRFDNVTDMHTPLALIQAGLQIGLGLGYIAVGWLRPSILPTALRVRQIQFSKDGIELEFTHPQALFPYRTCSWRSIRAIDDVDGLFVVRPYFRPRAVIPKRAFADGGIEARAFFKAHGVAGRIAPTHSATVLA